MDKVEFNKSSVDLQISIFNATLEGKSIRQVCEIIGIAKSTVLSRFSKAGYKYSEDLDVFVEIDKLNNVEMVEKSSPDIGKTQLEEGILAENINAVRERLGSIVRNFIEVGVILLDIKNNKSFEVKGYNDILSFSYSEFGLSKNQTYNLISVAQTFTNSGNILDKYKDFSFSQLVEMVSVPENQHNEVSVDMKVKDIRDLKKQVHNVKIVIIPEDDFTNKLLVGEKNVYNGEVSEKKPDKPINEIKEVEVLNVDSSDIDMKEAGEIDKISVYEQNRKILKENQIEIADNVERFEVCRNDELSKNNIVIVSDSIEGGGLVNENLLDCVDLKYNVAIKFLEDKILYYKRMNRFGFMSELQLLTNELKNEIDTI